MKTLTYPKSFDEWRTVSRALISRDLPPEELLWQSPQEAGLFGSLTIPQENKTSPSFRVTKEFLDLARLVSCHRSEEQWGILYSMLWRISQGERNLLQKRTDPAVDHLSKMAKSIRRDIHKMHAFVRFRKVGHHPDSGREQFVAWFEPEHRITSYTASFFRKRFHAMDWSILTPDECMHWDGREMHFTEGCDQSHAPDSDAQDELWRSYYKSIFNPARLKVKAMQSEMPKKYWKNLPEADLIDSLIKSSARTTAEMLETPASPEKEAPKNAYLERLKALDGDE